jgi:hypothetical protein
MLYAKLLLTIHYSPFITHHYSSLFIITYSYSLLLHSYSLLLHSYFTLTLTSLLLRSYLTLTSLLLHSHISLTSHTHISYFAHTYRLHLRIRMPRINTSFRIDSSGVLTFQKRTVKSTTSAILLYRSFQIDSNEGLTFQKSTASRGRSRSTSFRSVHDDPTVECSVDDIDTGPKNVLLDILITMNKHM